MTSLRYIWGHKYGNSRNKLNDSDVVVHLTSHNSQISRMMICTNKIKDICPEVQYIYVDLCRVQYTCIHVNGVQSNFDSFSEQVRSVSTALSGSHVMQSVRSGCAV